MTYRHIEVTPMTSNIGAVIGGVDLNHVRSEDVYEEIKHALWHNHVVFFRKQDLKPEGYIRLGEKFGEMEQHEFFPHIKGHPQIQLISHEGSDAPETDRWHTDVTFRKKPNMVSLLRITDLPPSGGDTMWMSTAAAFDALPTGLQHMLEGLDAEHDLPWHFRRINGYERLKRKNEQAAKRTGAEIAAHEIRESGSMMATLANSQEFKMIEANPPVTHPAVIVHPITGRKQLFVNSIWTKRLLGIHMDLSEHLLNMLYEWVKKPEFMVRFKWEPNSLAMWDNCATQHYAVFDYAPHYRAGQRMTCGNFVPSRSGPQKHAGSAPSAGSSVSQLIDIQRLQASSAQEQAAVKAIFSALEGVDLNSLVSS